MKSIKNRLEMLDREIYSFEIKESEEKNNYYEIEKRIMSMKESLENLSDIDLRIAVNKILELVIASHDHFENMMYYDKQLLKLRLEKIEIHQKMLETMKD